MRTSREHREAAQGGWAVNSQTPAVENDNAGAAGDAARIATMFAESQPLTKREADEVMASYRAQGHRLIRTILCGHAAIALALGYFYDTWWVTIPVAAAGIGMFAVSAWLFPRSFFTRCMAGVSLQVFVALHIYQMHGLPEMHFFFFTAFAAMIAYCDWKAMWPGTLLIIGQHILFALLTNSGLDMRFFPESYVGFTKLFFHFGIALVHVGICGAWAHMRQKQILEDARRNRDLRRALAVMVAAMTEIEHKSDQLEAANGELREARVKAVSATEAKSQFLANMSHEIRTPMTAILGYCDVLLEESRRDATMQRHEAALATIRRNGTHLLEVVNDILDLSKIEAGHMTMASEAVNVESLIADASALLRSRAEEKQLRFEVYQDGPLPLTIRSDATRLRQILINLLGNAVKFTDAGSVRLVVRCVSHEQPAMEFDVVDTGIGLTDEQLGRLFAPFTQADATTTRRFGGTGLGLAISKRLAQLLGGDITITSEPGVGSTFRLRVATGPIDAVARFEARPEMSSLGVNRITPMAAQASDSQAVHSLEGISVLLAEDGLDNQRLIAHIVRKAGAKVAVVDNGQQAIDAAWAARVAGEPFDAILMDMQMPVLDGYQATRRLREQGYEGTILALTAHAMSGDRERCLQAGCDSYTTKPIERWQLIELIGRQVAKSRRTPHKPNVSEHNVSEPNV
jgi:signal transduction histidine kinase/FixJ family two-component response regulator